MSIDRRAALLRHAVAALLLGWIAFWFVYEVDALRRAAAAPPNPGVVGQWRLATPRAEAFGHWVTKMGPQVPQGAVVVFTSSTGSTTQDFFLTLWAAYHLPRARVIPLQHPQAWKTGEYLLAYDTTVDETPDGRRLSVTAADHVGVLYRIDAADDGPLAP